MEELKVYEKSVTSIENRKENQSEKSKMIEKNLLLLGTSTTGDKLQEHVTL